MPVTIMRDGKTVTLSDEEAAVKFPVIDEGPPPVPTELHAAWIRAALAEIGKADAINAAVTAAGPIKQALWDFATTIKRNDPDVIAIATACGVDLEALFRRADEIRLLRA